MEKRQGKQSIFRNHPVRKDTAFERKEKFNSHARNIIQIMTLIRLCGGNAPVLPGTRVFGAGRAILG